MEIDDSKVHDFTKDKLGWGWNVLDFSPIDRTANPMKANMMGIGKNIQEGEYVLVSAANANLCWKVDTIDYNRNPKDLFIAELILMGEAP